MERIGTIYGGWYLPIKINLNEDSIVYSAGVGEDISFDLKLQSKYKCNIFLIDPTSRSKIHYKEVKQYYIDNIFNFTGNTQIDYYTHIHNIKPNFDKILYIDKGLWSCVDRLKFYKQENKKNVSQSLIPNMFGNEYDEVDVLTIKDLMNKYDHKNIDLLKLDIEGAEIEVLNNMLDNNIYPKYILVELDLYLKKKDNDNLTKKLIDRLTESNYKIIMNDRMNITLERTI
mgnify:FL=1